MKMLTKFRDTLTKLLKPLIWVFVKVEVDPNLLTISSLVLAFAYIVFITMRLHNDIPLHFILYVTASLLDSIDGAVARELGKTSEWGAFLDSLIDRACDGIFIFSLYLLNVAPIHLVIAEVIGAFLVSYARARGESLGVQLEGVGITERSERLILIFTTIVLAQIDKFFSIAVFYLLLFLTYVTVIQRVIYIRNELCKSR